MVRSHLYEELNVCPYTHNVCPYTIFLGGFGIRLALSALDMFVNLSKIRRGSIGIPTGLIKRAVRNPDIIRNYSVRIVF